MSDLYFIKLGGSLLTDKQGVETARLDTIARVAGELSVLMETLAGRTVVGHGSGSFGHVAAETNRIGKGAIAPDQLEGVSATQGGAARLHRFVFEALESQRAKPFSLAPSSFLVSSAGRPRDLWTQPLERALDAGLLPVVFGDVVMDLEWGASICSTEAVFSALIRELGKSGRRVETVLWLGITPGIYDADGQTISRIDAANVERVLEATRGAAGTDVTGGMRHRLQTAWDLAQMGVRSWIGDGREPGIAASVLRNEPAGGTWVDPPG